MSKNADNRYIFVSFHVDSLSGNVVEDLYAYIGQVFGHDTSRIIDNLNEVVLGLKVPKTTSVNVMRKFFEDVKSVFQQFSEYTPHFTQIREVEEATSGGQKI